MRLYAKLRIFSCYYLDKIAAYYNAIQRERDYSITSDTGIIIQDLNIMLNLLKNAKKQTEHLLSPHHMVATGRRMFDEEINGE
ncbi:hypothetical protein [Candidatus Borreliella tachyglossi]|uniref:hypothetical protein n=1 Tax=Candidatus Borreliella tachyglossi TaxID=1964448 RepID=UPI004042F064